MDITDIKIANVRKILNTLRFSSGMTKRDIAATTGLSFSSVSNICNDLSDLKILYMQKDPFSTVGRTPDKYCFQTTKYCSICLTLQRENLWSFSVLDFANHILFETSTTISVCDNIEPWLAFVQRTYQELLQSRQFADTIFVGVGAAIPKRQVSEAAGLTALSWESALRDAVSQRIGLPCYVQTPANLCAVSMYQSNTEIKNILYLYSAGWLGLGAICEGIPLHGQHNRAAEVFHLPLGDNSVICPICGERGCIGNELARAGIDAQQEPGLTEAEHDGLFQDWGRRLGELIGLLAQLFDPGIFYIGGLEQHEQIMPHAISVLRRRFPDSVDSGFQLKIDTDCISTIRRGINQVIYEDWYPLK
jgi:predicted NBD/HSP70 family sugar kinase